jgi:Raf kinase inhibitor-like YbhB/YbcL family protein
MRFRLLALLAVALLAGCMGGEDGPDPETLTVASPAFAEDGSIPQRFTCDGEDVSPPLEIGDVPDEAGNLSLLVSDPDAPSGTFDHWVGWNRPPNATSVPEGASGSGFQGIEGQNDFDEAGWRGPCPPEGEEHRYVFRVYAVDGPLDLGPDADGADLREALTVRVLAQGALTALYGS